MFTRRQLLRSGAGISLASLAAHSNARAQEPSLQTAPPSLDRGNLDTFPLGVASADPTPNGIVLWTHIPPAHHKADATLQLEIAADPQFSTPVITRTLNGVVTGERDGCVTVLIDEGLQPDTYYWYRFQYAGTQSRMGRCHTLPVTTSSEKPLKIAVVNCQEFSNGYYAAYHHLANEADIAFVLHLGDSIYERVAGKAYLQHPHADRLITLPSGGDVAMDLADYRALYRHYRSDPDYQQALAMHTFIFQLDDHELANNNYWDSKLNVMGVADHPYGDTSLYPDSVSRLHQLQRDGLRAWSEYMPSRFAFSVDAANFPANVQLYRRLQVGDTAFLLMDSRLARSKPPCNKTLLPLGCEDYLRPDLSLLGEQQHAWLLTQLQDTQPRWTILASQVAMSRIAVGNARQPWGVANTDAWDGYAHERAQLMAALQATQRRRFVVLSGDMHASLAGVLMPGELAPNLLDPDAVLGAEFMSPPISSPTTFDLLFPRMRQSGLLRRVSASVIETLFGWMNPQLQFVSTQVQGYSVLDIGADQCRWQAKVVEVDVPASLSPLRVAADFVYAPEQAGARLIRQA